MLSDLGKNDRSCFLVMSMTREMWESSKLALPVGLEQRQLTFQDLLWKLFVADKKEMSDLAAKFVTSA